MILSERSVATTHDTRIIALIGRRHCFLHAFESNELTNYMVTLLKMQQFAKDDVALPVLSSSR